MWWYKMNLNISNLYSWEQIKSGNDSSIVISNDGRKVKTSGSVGSGAQLWFKLPISYGGLYKVSFYAKRNRGEGYAWLVDSKNDKIMNSVKITSNHWERYEIFGGVSFSSKNGDNYFRLSIGVATANDGDIEVCDINAEEINSTFGQLRTIGAGIIKVNNGTAEIAINHGGLKSAVIENNYSLNIECVKLHSTLKTPMIFITEMSPSGTETLGVLRSRYYDKTAGVAMIQLVDMTTKAPKSLTTANLLFSVEIRSV